MDRKTETEYMERIVDSMLLDGMIEEYEAEILFAKGTQMIY